MRSSISRCSRSQSEKPYGRMTMVPRAGPFSASSAFATTSWYQRGKSSPWGVSTGALAMAAEGTGDPLPGRGYVSSPLLAPDPPGMGGGSGARSAGSAGGRPGDAGEAGEVGVVGDDARPVLDGQRRQVGIVDDVPAKAPSTIQEISEDGCVARRRLDHHRGTCFEPAL